MGRTKNYKLRKTTISKMMKSLAILAASLAAVQAQQGLGRLLNGEEGVLNDNFSEADFEHCMDHQDDDWCVEQCENREIARMYSEMCGRHLEEDRDGIADGGMSEEDCDENSRECGRHLDDIPGRYALNNFFKLLDPWNEPPNNRRMLSDGDTYEKNGQTCWLKGNGNEKCCDPDKYWKKNGNHRCRR